MFYAFSHTVTTGDIVTSKKRLDMFLTSGVIHQVDILFQDGCEHLVNVQVFLADLQLWPSNRGYAMRGNSTVVSFREFLELPAGGSTLSAYVWGNGVVTGVEVVIQIGLLPKRVLQPLSFEELLKAATGG